MAAPASRPAVIAALILMGGSAMRDATAAEFKLLRPGHPRLELDAAGLEEARKNPSAVAAAKAQGEGQLAIPRTGSYRDFWVELPSGKLPKPHPGDNWPYWTGICAQVGGYLATMSHAYAVTGDERFLSAAKQLALAVAQWPQWTDPDYGTHPCLDTHSLVNGMGRAYDRLYAALSEAERKTLRDAIVEKGLRFISRDGQDEKSYLFQPNAWPNGYAVINSSMGIGALAVLGDEPGAEEWLSRSIDKTKLFFDQQAGKDGGLLEGFGYGSFAIDTIVAFLQALHDLTGVSLLDTPYLDQGVYFPAYFMVPGGGSLPAIADNGGPAGCPPTLTGLAQMVMKLRRDPLAAWYLKQAGQGGEEIARLAAEPEQLPLGRHFPSVDWAALRSGWGPQAALLAFKCGQTKSHNHLDQNSFLLAWGKEWLLTDPGYQIYDIAYPAERQLTREVIRNRHLYTAETYGHNALLVEGEGQSATPGRITGFFTSPAMTCVVGDASGPYEKTLKAFTRQVVSLPGGDYVICDRVATDGTERAVEALFHTTHDGVFLSGGAELATDRPAPAGEVTVARSEGEVRLLTLLPEQATITRKVWPGCAEYGHYVTIAGPRKIAAGVNLLVLRPGPRGATEPLDAQRLSVPGGAGMVSQRADGTETVIFGPAGEKVSVGGLEAAGACALLVERRSRTSAGLYHGTILRRGAQVWLSCSRPADVGAAHEGGVLRIDLAAPEPTDFEVFCPMNPQLVNLEGVRSPLQFEYDAAARMLRLKGVQGNLRLEARPLPR